MGGGGGSNTRIRTPHCQHLTEAFRDFRPSSIPAASTTFLLWRREWPDVADPWQCQLQGLPSDDSGLAGVDELASPRTQAGKMRSRRRPFSTQPMKVERTKRS